MNNSRLLRFFDIKNKLLQNYNKKLEDLGENIIEEMICTRRETF